MKPKYINLFIIFCALFSFTKITSKTSLRSNFFTDIVGVSEADFRINKDNVLKNSISFDGKNSLFTNPTTTKTYQMGYFEEVSIKDLREKTKDIAIGGGVLNVIEATEFLSNQNRRVVDIGSMQADPKNNDAVFKSLQILMDLNS